MCCARLHSQVEYLCTYWYLLWYNTNYTEATVPLNSHDAQSPYQKGLVGRASWSMAPLSRPFQILRVGRGLLVNYQSRTRRIV